MGRDRRRPPQGFPNRRVHKIGNGLLNLHCLHLDSPMQVGVEVDGRALGQAHVGKIIEKTKGWLSRRSTLGWGGEGC